MAAKWRNNEIKSLSNLCINRNKLRLL